MAPTATRSATTTPMRRRRPSRGSIRAGASISVAVAWLATNILLLGTSGATAASAAVDFEPNIMFEYFVRDTARLIRYRSADSVAEGNVSSNWYTRLDPVQYMEDSSVESKVKIWGGGSTGHEADAISVVNTLSFVFVGTRAWVYGFAKGFVRGEGSYNATGAPDIAMQLNYDAASTDQITNLNFSASALNSTNGLDTGDREFGSHSVRVQLRPGDQGGLYRIHGFSFATGLKSEAANFDAVPTHTEYAVVNGSANPRWQYTSGTWNVEQPFEAAFKLVDQDPYRNYQHLNGVDNPQVVISLPQNTSFIVINGTSGPGQGGYTLGFSPDAILAPAKTDQDTGTQAAQWTSPVLLGLTPLNPQKQYTLTVSGSKGPGGGGVAIHSVTYYSGVLNNFPTFPAVVNASTSAAATPTDSTAPSATGSQEPDAAASNSKKTNAGAIAGGVIGGLVAGGIIAGLMFWYCRRRKRTVHREDPAEFVVDDTLEADPYPPRVPSKKGLKMMEATSPTNGGFVTYPSPKPSSSEGYTSEQLGISSPSSEGSQGYLLSPHGQGPDRNGKWTVDNSPQSPNQSPISPTTLLSPAVGPGGAPMASFSAFPVSGPPQGMAGLSPMSPVASSPLARSPHTYRTPRGPRAQRVHQEADGGSIHPDGEETSDSEDDVVIVPPSYDPAWRKSKHKVRASWKNEHALRLKTDIVSQIP